MPTKRACAIGIMSRRHSCSTATPKRDRSPECRRPMSRPSSPWPREVRRTNREAAQTENDIRDQELISQHVERVVVHADRITVTLRNPGPDPSEAEPEATSPTKLTIPFAPRHLPRKGIAHAPPEHGTIDPRTRIEQWKRAMVQFANSNRENRLSCI
jgi:hypothetical protein